MENEEVLKSIKEKLEETCENYKLSFDKYETDTDEMHYKFNNEIYKLVEQAYIDKLYRVNPLMKIIHIEPDLINMLPIIPIKEDYIKEGDTYDVFNMNNEHFAIVKFIKPCPNKAEGNILQFGWETNLILDEKVKIASIDIEFKKEDE